MRPMEPLSRKHPTCLAVLGLATDLEACLREISQIHSGPGSSPELQKLIDEHKEKPTFSDYYGVNSARIIRNRINHPRPGDKPLSLSEVERAKASLEIAVREVLPLCSQRLQREIARDLPPVSSEAVKWPAGNPTAKVENVCPECGHQFKGSGFDGIDAHWRARHEALMPYKKAWPLIKSGGYLRKGTP